MPAGLKLWLQRPLGDWLYPGALVFGCFYCLLCWLLYPIIVTFDSYVYLRLSKVLFTPDFPEQWYFLRTPLFPLLIKLQEYLFGLSARSLTAINVAFNIATILLVGATSRILAGPRLAALAVLLASLYPYSIGMSLTVLLESGTTFFVTLFCYLLVRPVQPGTGPQLRDAFLLALAMLLAYLHRQNLLYLLPFLALVWLVRRIEWRQPLDAILRSAIAPAISLVVAFAILVLPVVTWWSGLEKRFPTASPTTILIAGLIKQSVYPSDDPRLGVHAAQYSAAYNKALADQGRLPTHGVPGVNYPLLNFLDVSLRARGSAHLLDVMRDYPGRYLSALLRTTVYALNLREGESENGAIVLPMLVGKTPQGRFFPGPAGSEAVVAQLRTTSQSAGLQSIQEDLAVLFDAIIVAAMFASLACLWLAWSRRSFRLAVPSVVVWGYLLPWLLVVHPNDRYLFPSHALAFVCLAVMFGALRRPPAGSTTT